MDFIASTTKFLWHERIRCVFVCMPFMPFIVGILHSFELCFA